jgi:stage II sporulation protein D
VPSPPVANEPWLDVGLAWDRDSLTVVPLRALRPSVLGDDARHTDTVGEPFVVRVSGGALDLARMRGRHLDSFWRLQPADTLVLRDASGDDVAPSARWNGRTWRGRLKLFVNARGKLTLATHLPLETYLLGVLPGEIGPLSDTLFEAGRAQAIAARSFTLYYRGRRGIEGFDLFATVEDQVYGSVESEKPLATRCVETTRGLTALSDGQPVRANYCSTCGGITAEVWEAWPEAPRSYLVSHRDHGANRDYCAGSPHFRWREEWSAREFLDGLRRFAPTFGVRLPSGDLGSLVDVRVASRSVSGRVWRLEVRTTRGVISVPAHSLRQVIRRPGNPGAILRSTLFKIDVRRAPGSRRALAVVASGAGSGHGVGLCQTGALGMARAGSDGERIIRQYYPGVNLVRLY